MYPALKTVLGFKLALSRFNDRSWYKLEQTDVIILMALKILSKDFYYCSINDVFEFLQKEKRTKCKTLLTSKMRKFVEAGIVTKHERCSKFYLSLYGRNLLYDLNKKLAKVRSDKL